VCKRLWGGRVYQGSRPVLCFGRHYKSAGEGGNNDTGCEVESA
jgi:hypothetical protein